MSQFKIEKKENPHSYRIQENTLKENIKNYQLSNILFLNQKSTKSKIQFQLQFKVLVYQNFTISSTYSPIN